MQLLGMWKFWKLKRSSNVEPDWKIIFERSMSHVHSCTDNRRDNIELHVPWHCFYCWDSAENLAVCSADDPGNCSENKKNPRKFTDDLKQVTFEQKLFLGITRIIPGLSFLPVGLDNESGWLPLTLGHGILEMWSGFRCPQGRNRHIFIWKKQKNPNIVRLFINDLQLKWWDQFTLN